MKPRIVTVTEPTSTVAPRVGMTVDQWEAVIFDSATLFAVVVPLGRGDWDRREFANFPGALEVARPQTRSLIYAVNAHGRSVALGRTSWDRWLDRYNANLELETQAMTINTEAAATPSVFLLHWNGNGPSGAKVERFASKTDATTYAFECLPGDRVAHVVADVLDLSDRLLFKGPTLVAIFNAITGNDPGVTKFENLDHGRERVFRELVRRFGEQPYTVIVAPEPVAPVPTTGSRKRATRETTNLPRSTTTAAPRGRKATFDGDCKITVLVSGNPKRAGTAAHDRFGYYRTGMKVSTFIEKGGTHLDLAYDVKKEFIKVDAPSV